MTSFDYTMDFDSTAEAIEIYGLRRLPVKGQAYYAGSRICDNGNLVRIFARQHIAIPTRFTFSERLDTLAA